MRKMTNLHTDPAPREEPGAPFATTDTAMGVPASSLRPGTLYPLEAVVLFCIATPLVSTLVYSWFSKALLHTDAGAALVFAAIALPIAALCVALCYIPRRASSPSA